MYRRSKGENGFSLLEILVAFSIMALCLGVLLRIFGGAGHIASTADQYSRAIIVAESLLASLGIDTPLRPGHTQGEIGTGYHWTLDVTPYPVESEGTAGQGSMGFKPYRVELTVEWGEVEDPRAFNLVTLRLLPDTPQGIGG